MWLEYQWNSLSLSQRKQGMDILLILLTVTKKLYKNKKFKKQLRIKFVPGKHKKIERIRSIDLHRSVLYLNIL